MADRKQCCEDVWGKERRPSRHKCTRPVTATVEGKDYCTFHSPAKKAERDAKSQAKWDAERKQKSVEYAGHEMLLALKDICLNNAGSKERQRGWDNALTIIERLEGPQ